MKQEYNEIFLLIPKGNKKMKGLCQPCGSVWWGLVRPILDSQDYHVKEEGQKEITAVTVWIEGTCVCV